MRKVERTSMFGAPSLGWIPFLVATALILMFSTDYFTGETAYYTFHDTVLPTLVTAGDESEQYLWWTFFKGRHVLAFLVLGLSTLFLRRLRLTNSQGALWLCGSIALASEMMQAFTLTRHPEVSDVALDLAAAVVGMSCLTVPDLIRQLHGWVLPLRSTMEGAVSSGPDRLGMSMRVGAHRMS